MDTHGKRPCPSNVRIGNQKETSGMSKRAAGREDFAATSIVHASVQSGEGVAVWHWSQIRENAVIGSDSSIGQNVYIGPGVAIGNNCKVQNGAQIYEPALLHDGVFIGPNVVLTNDKRPRAVRHDSGAIKKEKDWEKVGVEIESGASLGANVVCIGPVVIGQWAMIGAGAVITRDVKPHALVTGNPGTQVGWVGRGGKPLVRTGNLFLCPDTNEKFELSSDGFLIKV